MSKIADKRYMALGILLSLFLIMIVCICVIAAKNQKNDNWILKSLNNTVVLMNNGQIIEVFNEIVLDTLPEEDKQHLEKGIAFLTKDEAMIAVEDYDG